MSRLFFVGIDGAVDDRLFRVLESGDYKVAGDVVISGSMRVCLPPVTIPSWTCILSGARPDEVSMFGFMDRTRTNVGEKILLDRGMTVNTSLPLRGCPKRRLWELLDNDSIVVGVPQTYPVDFNHRGIMISGMLTPEINMHCSVGYSKDRLKEIGYEFDVPEFNRSISLEHCRGVYESHRMLCHELISKNRNSNLFYVDMEVDRVSHLHYGNDSIMDGVYRDSVDFLESVYVLMDDGDVLVSCSDHGFMITDKVFNINRLLFDMGYLVFKDGKVDYEKSVAWGIGGIDARVYLSVFNRDVGGILNYYEYDRVVNNILSTLRTMLPTPMFNFRRLPFDDSNMPDIQVFCKGYRWSSSIDGEFDLCSDVHWTSHGIDNAYYMIAKKGTSEGSLKRDINYIDLLPKVLGFLDDCNKGK